MITKLSFILADAAQQGGEEGGGSMVTTLIMMGLIVVVFYFFMIRPQMKQRKELQKFRNELKKDDKVMTMGGIHGRVAEIKEDSKYLMLEISKDVKIKVDKASIIKTDMPVMGQK